MLDSLLSALGAGGNGLLALLGGQANAQGLPQQPQAGPGMGDRLMAGFQGALNSSSPMGALGNLVGGISSGSRTDPAGVQASAVQGMLGQLLARGQIDPATAKFLAANPKAWEELSKAMINVPMQIAPDGSIIQSRPFGQLGIPGGVPISDRADVVNPDGSKSPGFAIKPSLTRPQGGMVAVGQQAPPPATPPILSPNQPNGGRGQPPLNPAYDGIPPSQAARVNGPITEMSPAERNAQEKSGTMRGEAQFNYPATVSTMTNTLDNVRGLKAVMDKPNGAGSTIGDVNLGMGRGVGWLASMMGSEGSSEFRSRLAQLSSRVWMSEIKNMVGMGALSNAEGSRVQEAAARLQTTQDPKVFKESLNELESTLNAGISRARLQAFGRQQVTSGSAPIPSPPRGFTIQ